jgi:P27 family predicted phage terminase small subunit
MGSRGPLRRRGGQALPREGNLVPLHAMPGGLLPKPMPDEDWLPAVLEAWEALFTSDLANRITAVDLPAVRRLFSAYDRHARLEAILIETPFIQHGAEVRSHPAEMVVRQLARQILALETHFGLTLLARERLGIAIGKHALTAADVNAMTAPGGRRKRSKTYDAEWIYVDNEGDDKR